jgi:hypothetical protein
MTTRPPPNPPRSLWPRPKYLFIYWFTDDEGTVLAEAPYSRGPIRIVFEYVENSFDSILGCDECNQAIRPGAWYWKRQIDSDNDDDEWTWDPREEPPDDYWLEGMLGTALLCRSCVKLKGYKADRTWDEWLEQERNPKPFWQRR